jgi:3-phenylpropionate/cinnamic acid dioxygenase small subunit
MEAADEGIAKPRDSARAVIIRASRLGADPNKANGREMETIHDASLVSHYVTDAFYRDLIAAFKDWQRDDRAVLDAAERDRFRALIEREARLLDRLDLDAWLSMYAHECIYWVPATPSGGDPRREIAISFDDRRRMEDRIYRLRTGYAWSQAPASRTVRMISNVEVFAATVAATRMVRSNFLISEFRPDGVRFLSGWCGHRFAERNGRWEIEVRQVNLIDCDQNLRNPSIIL